MSLPPDAAPDPLGTPLARASFEASTECQIVLDPEGVVIAVNRAFCRLYGIKARATVGRHYMAFSKDFEIRRSGDPLERERWVTAGALRGETLSGIVQGVRNHVTGREFFGRYGTTPVREGERLVATIITVLDVTEATRAAQSLDAALSAAEVGTWRADMKEGKVWADANFARLCGVSEQAVRGGPLARLYELIHPDDSERATKAFRAAAEARLPHEVEYRVVLPDESVRWLVSRGKVALSESGEPCERVGSIVDLTRQKESEQALRENEERTRLALEAARMGTWEVDVRTEAARSSPDVAALYGMPAGYAHPSTAEWLAAVHPDDRARLAEARRGLFERGEPYEQEFRVPQAGGGLRWLHSRASLFCDAEGQPWKAVGVVSDVTERKAAEAALRRAGEAFESLVRNSPLGVYAVDADFRLALVSQGAQRVFENVRPLLGRDFAEAMRTVWEEPFASEAIRLFRHTLETGEPYHAPGTIERREDLGEVESYDWKIDRVPMPDGRLGAVCHFYDLSERQRRQADLERAVEARTVELVRANRDLDQFAYSVAHDLRAPLRTIVSTSRMLLDDAADRLTEEELTLLRRQATNGVRLARIVDDLLGFARLANAGLRKTEFDLTALAGETAREVTRRWEACRVEVQEGMRAQGDPSLVGYVLTNLLDNACKFSPGGGAIAVGEEDGAFFVRDQGVGFDMAYAPKLFVAFERLVGQETFQGTGVGLANVKRIIEKHGGRVWAESEPGKGATFRFTLG